MRIVDGPLKKAGFHLRLSGTVNKDQWNSVEFWIMQQAKVTARAICGLYIVLCVYIHSSLFIGPRKMVKHTIQSSHHYRST